MRETIDIRTFGGIITVVDQEDIPAEAASYSLNVDCEAEGKLQGISGPTAVSITSGDGANIKRGAWINNDQFDFIYYDSEEDKIKAITDFHGTPTASDLITSNVGESCLQSNNKEVHIGTGSGSSNVPKWVGYIDYGQFGGSVPSGLQSVNAECAYPTADVYINSITENEHTTVATDGFQAGDIGCFALSVVYDGYQESPLNVASTSSLSGLSTKGYNISTGNSSEGIDIEVKVDNASSQNKRISAINIYHAPARDAGIIPTTYEATESFRLIKTIDMTVSSGWTGTTTKTYTHTDDGTGRGATYQANTGIPETLESTIINYELSTKGDGFHFVGKCYHADIPDADHYIFQSKEKRFDMFDWSKDFVRLPETPTALEYYAGRLYAFTNNKMYRIEPKGMYIEDEYQGAGIKGNACVTPYGMFWGNDASAFKFDGQFEIINGGIRDGGDVNWGTFAFSTMNMNVVYESHRKQVLFTNHKSDGTVLTWAFHVVKNRWDLFDYNSITVNADSGVFTDAYGYAYISNISQLVKLFAGTRLTHTWVSHELKDNSSQDKKFYHIVADYTGNLVITFGVEGNDLNTYLTNTTEVRYPSDWAKAKSIQIKLVGETEAITDSISLLYRKMEGARVYG